MKYREDDDSNFNLTTWRNNDFTFMLNSNHSNTYSVTSTSTESTTCSASCFPSSTINTDFGLYFPSLDDDDSPILSKVLKRKEKKPIDKSPSSYLPLGKIQKAVNVENAKNALTQRLQQLSFPNHSPRMDSDNNVMKKKCVSSPDRRSLFKSVLRRYSFSFDETDEKENVEINSIRSSTRSTPSSNSNSSKSLFPFPSFCKALSRSSSRTTLENI